MAFSWKVFWKEFWKKFPRKKDKRKKKPVVKQNPPKIDTNHPDAPASSLPAPKPKTANTLSRKIVNSCHLSLDAAGKITYTQGVGRRALFHRPVNSFAGSSADCSQFCAAIMHWHGVKGLSDTDYTGTLLKKGKLIPAPKVGCVVIWGPGTGAHAAFITAKVGLTDWMTVGFGHQGAPDRNLLSSMNRYFRSVNEPGVRFLSFS